MVTRTNGNTTDYYLTARATDPVLRKIVTVGEGTELISFTGRSLIVSKMRFDAHVPQIVIDGAVQTMQAEAAKLLPQVEHVTYAQELIAAALRDDGISDIVRNVEEFRNGDLELNLHNGARLAITIRETKAAQ
jgi:hypothetical protein